MDEYPPEHECSPWRIRKYIGSVPGFTKEERRQLFRMYSGVLDLNYPVGNPSRFPSPDHELVLRDLCHRCKIEFPEEAVGYELSEEICPREDWNHPPPRPALYYQTADDQRWEERYGKNRKDSPPRNVIVDLYRWMQKKYQEMWV